MIDLLFEDELKELLAKCEDIVPEDTYVVDEYTKERDREFDLAQKSGVDLSAYSSNEYTGFRLHEIRLGLEHKVNVSLYDDLGFSWEQMRQIRKGPDVSLYADLPYSDAQMREIRLGLENDLNVLSYAKLIYSKTDMHKMRTELFAEKYAVDPESFANTIVDPESGAVIRFTDNLMEAYVRLPQGCSHYKHALKGGYRKPITGCL